MSSQTNTHGTVLLLGGTSDIGGEVAERICHSRHVVLAARKTGALGDVDKRLRDAGATSVRSLEFDAADLASHRLLVELSLIHI